MKKWAFISFFAFIFLVGCSNDDAYENAIQKGLDYIASEEYEKAESAFELALDEKNNDKKAQALYEQIVLYQEAQKSFEENELDIVEEKAGEIKSIDDGSSALSKKTDGLLTSIEELETTLTDVKEEYEIAVDQYEDQNYKEADKNIKDILKNDLDHSIFKSIKEDTKELKKDVKVALESEEESEQEENDHDSTNNEQDSQKEEESEDKENEQELSLDGMRNSAKQYVDEWNGYDNTLTEEDWLDDNVWRYYIFQDGPTQHEVGVVVNSETGEVKGDYGGID